MSFEISKNAMIAINMLEESGFEAYVVGGSVRDLLMGRLPSDWDICTSALPNQALDCFKSYKCIPTGIRHGTITVVIERDSLEITTFRTDGTYSDGRRPDSVILGVSLIDDLSRRDFTINAIAYNPAHGTVDPFAGENDIKSGIIRAVGDPQRRFAEDALRILRAVRFASTTDFSIDPLTLAAAKGHASLLNNIAKERIWSEFCKIILGPASGDGSNWYKNGLHRHKSFENNLHRSFTLDDFKEIITVFIPEIKGMFGFDQKNPHHIYDVWQHTLHAVEAASSDLIIKLTMFFHDIGKPHTFSIDKVGVGHFYGHAKKGVELTDIILRRLKCDTRTREDVLELIRHHDSEIIPEPKYVRKWLNRLGEERLRQLVEVKRADTIAKGLREETLNWLGTLDQIEHLINDISLGDGSNCYKLTDLSVNGNDLKGIGITAGREIGKTLSLLLDKVMNDELSNEKEILLGYLKKR